MIDRYNRKIEYIRVSVTDRCNLRCIYCMPETGVTKLTHKDILTFEEILITIRLLADLGIRKVRLTGGEPLLRRGLTNLIKDLKSIRGIEKVTLTTNGVLLPSMADDLISAGIDGINISLDTVNEKIFAAITRRDSLKNVLDGLRKMMASGLDIKLNCVPLVGFNDNEILDLVDFARNNAVKLRFIELMPLGFAAQFKGLPLAEVKSLIENTYGKLIPTSRNDLQGPARYFTIEGFNGQIGFIEALEHKFCNECNRIRLTSDGFLKLCLNSNSGLDIKTLLRSGVSTENLAEEIRRAIYNKPKEHHFDKKCDETRMYQIGG